MRSYNLFRLKDGADLCCAVPENRAVPGFVGRGRWTFGGKIEDSKSADSRSADSASRLPGFDGKAAATAVRYNGFYLFQCAGRRSG